MIGGLPRTLVDWCASTRDAVCQEVPEVGSLDSLIPSTSPEQAQPTAPDPTVPRRYPHPPIRQGGGPARVVPLADAPGRADPVVVLHGQPHVVLSRYPRHHGLRLYSLRIPATYRCDACQRSTESTMVATTRTGAPTCPACYAGLTQALPTP